MYNTPTLLNKILDGFYNVYLINYTVIVTKLKFKTLNPGTKYMILNNTGNIRKVLPSYITYHLRVQFEYTVKFHMNPENYIFVPKLKMPNLFKICV